ncbi:N-6 DNA methylase [Paracoccus sp. ME4]|uniref:N-6 DNA methylase n=1 Tax=Paracoccus sp. ME4 TaxID=3138066 RepID=UPI00398AEED2
MTLSRPARDLQKLLERIAPYRGRDEVFRDLMFIWAASLRLPVDTDPALARERQAALSRFKESDRRTIGMGLDLLIEALEEGPQDVLGPIYMDLGLGSKELGQFFTPNPLTRLMAELVAPEDSNDGPRAISDPACGSGGTFLAEAARHIEAGRNPAMRMAVHGIDVSRTAILMCYIQLTLWNIPAELVVGNAITLEVREIWRTPSLIRPELRLAS